jgi:glycosyltransferase A (GT-A) superfamily protein (DUF2064 family)
MAKAPIPGVAKTRLGREIGYDQAALLYQAFLLDTLDLLDEFLTPSPTGTRETGRILMCPDVEHARLLAHIIPRSWSTLAQRRPRLMGGIADAFAAGFATDAEVVLVTDADSPALPPMAVATCAELAQEHDVVLGPTPDGGYYLIGARRAAAAALPDLLLGPSYDSATIRVATIKQATALGLSTATGPVSFDVDTAAELAELRRDLVALPAHRLRHTRRALARYERGADLERIAGDAP